MGADTTVAQSELDAAVEKLLVEVREGVKHGFFDISISCEIMHGQKRRLTIKAGKNYRFIIPEEDLRR